MNFKDSLNNVKKTLLSALKSGERFRIRVSTIVIKNNNILLAFNPFSDKDRYYIPGGGVDAGENIKEAARREILEEIGVHIDKLHILPIVLKFYWPGLRIGDKKYDGIISLFFYAHYIKDKDPNKSEFDYVEKSPEEAIQILNKGKMLLRDIDDLWIISLINKEIECIKLLKDKGIIKKNKLYTLDREKIRKQEEERQKYIYKDGNLFQYNIRIAKNKDIDYVDEVGMIDWIKGCYDRILEVAYNIYKKKVKDARITEDEFKNLLIPKLISFYKKDSNKIMLIFQSDIKDLYNKYLIVFIDKPDITDVTFVDKNVFKKD